MRDCNSLAEFTTLELHEVEKSVWTGRLLMVDDLFPETKQPRTRRIMMFVSDAAMPEAERQIVKMTCRKCGKESGWLTFDTVTAAKRGIPCDDCNKAARLKRASTKGNSNA